MYLIDTNIWLERVLAQERADEVDRFFARTPSDIVFVTDFSLHSIGLILTRQRRDHAFRQFVGDLFITGDVGLVRLRPADLLTVVEARGRIGLDFDDAYQYVAADTRDLTLVSFDADFDATDRGRKTPADVLADEPADTGGA